MKLVQIPIGRILPSPHNPRHEALGLDELAQSIKAVGIIEPLVVSIVQDDPEHVTLVCGNRRFGAAKLAGLKQVPCLVLPAVGERTERTISLVENLHRRDMSHIEQGEAFKALMDTGLKMREVAKMTGVSEATVSVKVGFVTGLIPEIQQLVHEDKIRINEARELVKLPFDAQRRFVQEGAVGGRRPNKTEVARRSQTEKALMAALTYYRSDCIDLALAEAKRAVGHLETRAAEAARGGVSA